MVACHHQSQEGHQGSELLSLLLHVADAPLLCAADGRPRTKCVILAHLDTGMSYIPGFIVSFVLKVICRCPMTHSVPIRPRDTLKLEPVILLSSRCYIHGSCQSLLIYGVCAWLSGYIQRHRQAS